MKRLLGLLLVMGMVGCGGGDEAPPAGETVSPATSENAQAKVDEPPVQTVDGSKLVRRDGLVYERDSETLFTGVRVEKHANGQKHSELHYKDGKCEGLWIAWHENGKKEREATYKDGKPEGPAIAWHDNGQKAYEGTYKDGKLVSATQWDEEGNEIGKD